MNLSSIFDRWRKERKYQGEFLNFFICNTRASFKKINHAIDGCKIRAMQDNRSQIALNIGGGPYLLEFVRPGKLARSTFPQIKTEHKWRVFVRKELMTEFTSAKQEGRTVRVVW